MKRSRWEKVVIGLIVDLLLWPVEALLVMAGLSILDHYGFGTPTPGYWSCWIVVLGIRWTLAPIRPLNRSDES